MTKRFVLFNLPTKKWEKEEICAVKPYSQKKNSGWWEGSVECFTEDRQGIRPLGVFRVEAPFTGNVKEIT
jgi:hypothetical protein